MIVEHKLQCDYDCPNCISGTPSECRDAGWKVQSKTHLCPSCWTQEMVQIEHEKSKQFGKGTYRGKVAVYFQKMIRLRDAVHQGDVAYVSHGKVFTKHKNRGELVCVTCGKTGQWDSGEWDAGHFLSRSNHATIFVEINCHAQCKSCNGKYGGSRDAEYQVFMEAVYGHDVVYALKCLSSEFLADWNLEPFPPTNVLTAGELMKEPNEDFRYYYARLLVEWKRRIKQYEKALKC